MKPLEAAFSWIALHFTTEAYMLSSKIQGILWSMADLALIFILLKISDVVRSRAGRRKILFRYILLCFSAILTPLLAFTQEPKEFFILESIICGIQFSILLYSIAVEGKDMMDFFKEILSSGKA